MADEERADSPPPAPPDEPKPADGDKDQPPSRDDAVHKLRTETPELSSIRYGKIVAEGARRLADFTTVNVFQGDFFVDGDFVATASQRRRTGGGRAAREGLDLDAVRREQENFVPPPGFDDGVDLLLDKRLLILSGPARTGLRTRALATLLAAMRKAGIQPRLAEVGGGVLGNTSWRVPRAETGLLLEDRTGKDGKFAAETVNDAWLELMSDRLGEHRSFLVVVTGPVAGSLATASKRGEFVLDDLELPDPLEIVRLRVHNELAWDRADLDRRLAGTELAELLAERDDPSFAVRAAQRVIDALRENGDLAAAVGRLRDTEGEVREWLDREPDLKQIAFVMAAAVLEGASYLSVSDAAVDLYRRLSSNGAAMTPRYLKELRLERNWIEWPRDEDGGITVRFKHARLRPVVLAVIWFEYDGARATIIGWLKSLADYTDVEVRARAAQAAGILAGNDFEHGMHQYLLPWAVTGSLRLQQSAATGLNIAGTTRDQSDRAWSYIELWAALAGGPKKARTSLQGTAGLAAGGELGAASPRRALHMLRTLVDGGDWSLLDAIAVSVQALLEAGRAAEVLDALMDWSDGPAGDDAVAKALMVFAFAVWPEGDTGEKPLLLAKADEHRDELPELWGRALAAEAARPLAVDALRAWVRWVDADPSLWDTVIGVVAGIADRPGHDYHRLLHLLEEWALDPDDPSDAAREFYHELNDAGEDA